MIDFNQTKCGSIIAPILKCVVQFMFCINKTNKSKSSEYLINMDHIDIDCHKMILCKIHGAKYHQRALQLIHEFESVTFALVHYILMYITFI